MNKPYQLLFNTINQPESKLYQLLAKVNHLQALNQLLAVVIEPVLAKHCQIATFEQGCLTIATDSPGWATKLRFQGPDIVEKLKKHEAFTSLREVRCIVVPDMQKFANEPTDSAKTLQLSEGNRKMLAETAKYIEEPSLKAALENLLKNSS